MGDRALVLFTDGTEVSPTVYLHWSGTNVPKYLEELKELMATRLDDVSYGCARFIGICHSKNAKDNCSLGVWSTDVKIEQAILCNEEKDLAKYSHGDAGVIVVDVKTYEWKAYGGYLAHENVA